jgi:two-component system, response regulator PdtaR
MGSRPHCPRRARAPSVAVMAQRTSFPSNILPVPRSEPAAPAGNAGSPRGRSGQGFWGLTAGDARCLRVLIANESQVGLEGLPEIVAELGHTVISCDLDAARACAPAQRAEPDVALVGLGPDKAHALGLIESIARKAACPVIAVLAEPTPPYVREAARCGAFAYSPGVTPEELQSAIDISMHRFADYRTLQGAFQRRAIIEQAKGILMARHALDAQSAFALLRNHSQNSGRKLVDIATLIVDSHLLLPQSVTHVPAGSRPPGCGGEIPPAPYARHENLGEIGRRLDGGTPDAIPPS